MLIKNYPASIIWYQLLPESPYTTENITHCDSDTDTVRHKIFAVNKRVPSWQMSKIISQIREESASFHSKRREKPRLRLREAVQTLMRYSHQQDANLLVLAFSVARKWQCYNVWQTSLSHHICGKPWEKDIYSNVLHPESERVVGLTLTDYWGSASPLSVRSKFNMMDCDPIFGMQGFFLAHCIWLI